MSAVPIEQGPQLIARKDGAIGWLILSNVAKHNAITFDMWKMFPTALADFAADPEVRMLVLTGDGTRAFASGADISQFERDRASGEALARYNKALVEATTALMEFPKPTIAKVRGICIGGGLALCLDCDLRFCSDDALFRMPAARLGLGYEFGGIKRMVEVIGAANACDVFFSARKFGAADALSMGLVSAVFPATEFDEGFAKYCTLVTENAPLTMAAAKRAIIEASKDAASRDMRRVEAMYQACFASEDYKEGRKAFMEKRVPQFKGK